MPERIIVTYLPFSNATLAFLLKSLLFAQLQGFSAYLTVARQVALEMLFDV